MAAPRKLSLGTALADIELFVLDVDGVLTQGGIEYSQSDTHTKSESKTFIARDGFGIALWVKAGFKCAWCTGRGGGAVRRRAHELGVQLVSEGSKDKAADVRAIATELGVDLSRVAHMGDDWPDLAAFGVVGAAFAPADADPHVRDRADYVTTAAGGRGAVREAIAMILDAKGMTEALLAEYTDPA
ncbi:MAG: HAD hydrolase family protein [Planctomycetota bacterium]